MFLVALRNFVLITSADNKEEEEEEKEEEERVKLNCQTQASKYTK